MSYESAELKVDDLKLGDKLRRINCSTSSGSLQVGDVVEVEEVTRAFVIFKDLQYPFSNMSNFELVSEEKNLKIRASDDWVAGDIAYHIRSNYAYPEGALFSVISLSEYGYLRNTHSGPGYNPQNFARILTPEEVLNLPEESTVTVVRLSDALPGSPVGQVISTGPHFTSNHRNSDLNMLIALISLPQADPRKKELEESITRMEQELSAMREELKDF